MNVAASAKSDAGHLDPAIPEEALLLHRKITCNSFDDTATRFEVFRGKAFSHRPGIPDEHLFDVIGSNVSRCETIQDPVRGTGFRKRANVILLYVDAETGLELDSWRNPITGKSVQASPMLTPNKIDSDVFPIQKDGTPFQIDIEKHPYLSTISYDSSISKKLPDGKPIFFSDFINRVFTTDDLFDRNTATLSKFQLTWTRVSNWPGWMEMDDVPGELIWHVSATSVLSFEDYPNYLRKTLTEKYPLYQNPPK